MKILSISAVFLISMLSGTSQAQQKPLPPVSPLQPRQVAQDTLPSPPATERQKLLELPEILVVGQDTSRRIPRSKSLPAVQQMDVRWPQSVFRRPSASPDLLSPMRQVLEKQMATRQYTVVDFSFGTYQTTRLKALHRQAFPNGLFRFEGQYASSEGQYSNSQFERWNADLLARFQLQQNHFLQVNTAFHSNRYGMYGDLQPFRRTWQWFLWNLRAGGKLHQTLSYQIELGQSHLPLSKSLDRTDTLTIPAPIRETATSFQGQLLARFQEWQVRFQTGAQLLRESPDTQVVGTVIPVPRRSQLLRTQLVAARKIPGRGIFEFGVHQFAFRSGQQKRTKIYPFLAMAWSLSPTHHLSIQYGGGMQLLSVRHFAVLNPFYSFLLPSIPVQETSQLLQATFNWTPGHRFRAYGSIAFKAYRDYFYWKQDTVSFRSEEGGPVSRNVFSPQPLEKVHILHGEVGIEMGNLNPWIVRATIQWTDSRIDHFGPVVSGKTALIKEIPYLEETGIQLEMQYKITPDFIAQIEGYYFGSRPVSLFSLKRAESIWLFNGKLTYSFAPFRFYLQVWNLLNQKFYLWEHYPLTTFQISGGLGVQF